MKVVIRVLWNVSKKSMFQLKNNKKLMNYKIYNIYNMFNNNNRKKYLMRIYINKNDENSIFKFLYNKYFK